MLHGRGEQYKFTKTYLKLRDKGLNDRTDLTAQELIDTDLDEDESLGGGEWDKKLYEFDNVPIPADRSKTKVDRRDVYGPLGEKTR